MSYILDALRRADAERSKGTPADSLLAQPPAEPGDGAPARGPARTGFWLAAGAAIPLAALLAWRMLAPEPEPAPRVAAATAPKIAAPAAPPAVAASAPASAPASAVEPAATAASTPAAPTPPPEAAAEPAVPDAEPAPPPRKVRTAKPRPPAREKKPAAQPAPPPEKSPEASPAPAPVRSLAELPDDLRRLVPAMTISGSVYSPQPADRMLVVNGMVLREGTAITPDLRLVSIGRLTAVFSIRGQRFEMKL